MPKKKPLDQVTLNLNSLSDDELRLVINQAQAILDLRKEEEAKAIAEFHKMKEERDRLAKQSQSVPNSGKLAAHSYGYYEWKTINGYGPYLYFRWLQGGKLRSRYMGKGNT